MLLRAGAIRIKISILLIEVVTHMKCFYYLVVNTITNMVMI